jgi:RNA polymerase sigma-70 factor (ECF subfamily)
MTRPPEPTPELLDACRRGDRDAFHGLFVATSDRVYAIALHYFSGDEATALDVTQDVYVKLFARIGQFRGESSFTTWLHRMVVNACLDEKRKRRRRNESMSKLTPEPLAFPDRQESASQADPALTQRLHEVLRHMKPPLRATLLLRYFEELSYDEMAQALGCSRGTVASRLNRAHRFLARRLGAKGTS